MLGESEAGGRKALEEVTASSQKGNDGGLDQESKKWAATTFQSRWGHWDALWVVGEAGDGANSGPRALLCMGLGQRPGHGQTCRMGQRKQ